MSDETPPPRGIRGAVDNSQLDAENSLHYLVLLATEARRYDGHWDGDPEQAARWVVAQWCQELGYVPDLSDKEPGDTVQKGTVPDHDEIAFEGAIASNEDHHDDHLSG